MKSPFAVKCWFAAARQATDERRRFRSPALHRFTLIALVAAGAVLNLPAAPYYQSNFESGTPPSGFNVAGAIIGTQGYASHGFGNSFLWSTAVNGPTPTLTLNNLPEHSSLTITFDLALVDSWDGTDPTWGPDYFNVQVNGTTVFSNPFSTWTLSTAPGTTLLLAQPGALGFHADFVDTAYRITITIPHTTATATVAWFANGAGWTGGEVQWPDESWAIDNISVSLLGGPSITQDPQDQSVIVGQSATFTAAAYVTSPAPALQWQSSIDNGENWTDLEDGGSIAGSTTGTLTVASTTLGMSGHRYRLKATYQGGPIYSASALLTVTPEPVVTAVLLTAAEPWRKAEFRLDNILTAANPFDPDVIRVDATFTSPTGAVHTVPAFWYQPFTRGLSGGYETITSAGSGQWRLRYTPTTAGNHDLTLTILTNGQPWRTVGTNFNVAAAPRPARFGYVRNDDSNRHFETGDGQPLRLIGANVCWPGPRGTLDYDDWFPAMQANTENFARLWMADWSFGIEAEVGTLNNYKLTHAWQLDYVFELAAERGIYLLLCVELDGIFQPFGWSRSPYNAANGGPVTSPNDFFTQASAQTLFKKRLRYLIARYGYSSHLLGWEFFNEINNSYDYINANDVVNWHGLMGEWLHGNDPYHHLVTTSLNGGRDQAALWSLPQMDFACYHSYGETAHARRFATVAEDFMQRYDKPVLVGEFGISGAGWRRTEEDPYLRGFRQALWGGAVGGSVGTAMSWWWENLHSENVYPLFNSLGSILNRTGWGSGTWTPVKTHADTKPPVTVGDPIPAGQSFDSQLALNTVWDGLVDGRFALPTAEASGGSVYALNGFLHGFWHDPVYRLPFIVNARFTENARVVIRVKTVAVGAILTVKVDGNEIHRVSLQNRDYNEDFPVNLPAGLHTVELFNPGSDWIYLDWVRFERVLPSQYAGNWQPPAETIGLKGPRETLLYVTAPGHAFPSFATNATVPVFTGQSIVLTNWPPGNYIAEWYRPTNGVFAGRMTGTTVNGALMFALPDFTEDLAGIVYAPPSLTPVGFNPAGRFQLQLNSETGGAYTLDRSGNLPAWVPGLTVTNITGTLLITDPESGPSGSHLYRLRRP